MDQDTWRTNYRCPRCSEYLVGHPADGQWALWFECHECWMAFCFFIERGRRNRRAQIRTLVQGRKTLAEANT